LPKQCGAARGQQVALFHQGPVVQSTISAIPGLNFNLLFLFMHFCTSICFKTSEKKTFIGPDKISEEIFPSL
jgi:hypothetical protein